MKEVSNSLNPYEIVGGETDHYWFLTDLGAFYYAHFTSSSGLSELPGKVLTFSFRHYCTHPHWPAITDETGDRPVPPRYDRRIMETIAWLISESLRKSPETAIAFICESNGGCAPGLQRLFERWYRETSRLVTPKIAKYDSDFSGEGYGSIFVHQAHPEHESIKTAFQDFSYVESD
ncbi:hypothetical protein [Dyadobacter sp. 676]|uniref:Uncharacterized protein n=1 Tax=Dyadobacter sp. 676 TaxID=3088362 RepID=A0AAU8FN24_9BACT